MSDRGSWLRTLLICAMPFAIACEREGSEFTDTGADTGYQTTGVGPAAPTDLSSEAYDPPDGGAYWPRPSRRFSPSETEQLPTAEPDDTRYDWVVVEPR